MPLKKFNPRNFLLLLFIAVTATIRIILNFSADISPLANFSPLGAMAIFGGAYFTNRWKGVAFPLAMLFISDFVLHQTVFKAYSSGILYNGWYWVYGAFALMSIAGKWLLKQVTIKNFFLSVVVCVAIHWLVTDIGVWYGSKVFAQNLNGYMNCLVVAIPYEWRFITGTLVYGAILFGLFELMQQRHTFLKTTH